MNDGVHASDRPPHGVLVEQAALEGITVRRRFDRRFIHEAKPVAFQGFGHGLAQPARSAGDQEVHGYSFYGFNNYLV